MAGAREWRWRTKSFIPVPSGSFTVMKASRSPFGALKRSSASTECKAASRTIVIANDVRIDLTTQAQRPGARDARIATTTLMPGSLQRMVRRRL